MLMRRPNPGAGLLKWDVDFSLALHNRTGKYFLGREIIGIDPDLIGDVFYWRFPFSNTPTGLASRAIGWLEAAENRLRASSLPVPAAGHGERPVLHLDPLTAIQRDLRRDDIILCHDLGPVTHPELFDPTTSAGYARSFAKIAAVGPRIVFVSMSSERAFRELYGGEMRSEVIYPPIRPGFRNSASAAVPGLPENFLVTVGSIGARKNQRRAIEGFAASGLAREGIGYVICGTRDAGFERVARAAAETPGVVLLDYVTDGQLRWLYENARCFVLPSLLEGFGMPVAEAMFSGVLPIVSQHTVLEEVVGDCGLTVDPLSPEDIGMKMRKAISSTEIEDPEFASRMKREVARFSEKEFRKSWLRVLSMVHP